MVNTKVKQKARNAKKVAQVDIKTGEVVAVYESRLEAHKETGISYSGINQCCLGIQTSSGGFNWKNYDE